MTQIPMLLDAPARDWRTTPEALDLAATARLPRIEGRQADAAEDVRVRCYRSIRASLAAFDDAETETILWLLDNETNAGFWLRVANAPGASGAERILAHARRMRARRREGKLL